METKPHRLDFGLHDREGSHGALLRLDKTLGTRRGAMGVTGVVENRFVNGIWVGKAMGSTENKERSDAEDRNRVSKERVMGSTETG